MYFQFDKQNNLVTISNSLLKHFTKHNINETNAQLDAILQEKKYDKVVLMLFDGMGSSILEKHLARTDYLRRNVKFETCSIYPPTTVAATNALLSGKYPSQNGFLGWQQYFKDEDKVIEMFTNYDCVNKVKLDLPLISEKVCGYESILDIIKKKAKIDTGHLYPKWIKSDGVKDIHSFFTKADEMMKNKNSHFYYMYWPEPDSLIHRYGTDHYFVKNNVKLINKKVKTLARKNEDNLIIVLADHSLINTKTLCIYDHPDFVDCLKTMPSLDSRSAFFHVKEDRKTEFENLFKKYYGEYFILKTKEEVLKEEIFGPKDYHDRFESFFGEYLAMSISNYCFEYKKDEPLIGHHAGATKEEFLISVMILNV